MAMVFVAHRMTGVHPIPEEWLDGYFPSGFRYATATEVVWWHEERGLPIPADLEDAAGAASSGSDKTLDAASGDDRPSRWYAQY
jgi:hypothetical protein